MSIPIEGAWSVSEFSGLLADIGIAYENAATLVLLEELAGDSGPVEVAETLARVTTPSLTVHSISYESPGWLVVTGSLKVLGVVADRVAKARQWIHSKVTRDNRYIVELLDRVPEERRAEWAEALLEKETGLLRPAQSIATDRRLESEKIEVVAAEAA